MPRFCANLSMLYGEHDILDHCAAAADDGFEGVEYLFPYAYPKEELADRLRRHRLVQVLHNLPAGDWAGGERGLAVAFEGPDAPATDAFDRVLVAVRRSPGPG